MMDGRLLSAAITGEGKGLLSDCATCLDKKKKRMINSWSGQFTFVNRHQTQDKLPSYKCG